MTNSLICACFLFMSLFMISCTKKEAQSLPQQNYAKALQSAKNIYPHSADFKQGQAHGSLYISDANSCKTCHGSDLRGGTAKVSCNQCHATFPHVEEFKLGGHGAEFMKDSQSCKSCHGADLQGGRIGVSCNKCHQEFPHPEAFRSTKLHGKKFLENKESCKQCHGADLSGGKQVACIDCHKVYPHSQEFSSSSQHGGKYLGDKALCSQCHGKDLLGGDVKVSCKTCHDYPHAAGWSMPQGHGTAFWNLGHTGDNENIKDPLARNYIGKDSNDVRCLRCHLDQDNKDGASFKSRHPKEFVSCASCHSPMPHGQRFATPEVAGKKAISHGKYFDANGENKWSCYACHFNEKTKAPKMTTCGNCHDKDAPLPAPVAPEDEPAKTSATKAGKGKPHLPASIKK